MVQYSLVFSTSEVSLSSKSRLTSKTTAAARSTSFLRLRLRQDEPLLVDTLQQHVSLDPLLKHSTKTPNPPARPDSVRDGDRDREQRHWVSRQQITRKQPSAM